MTATTSRFAHLKGAVLSDIGRRRKNNEDSYGSFPEHGIWCVADGMGGGDDGEVASAAVVKSVDAYLSDLPTVSGGAYAGSQVAKGVITAIEDASGWIFRRTRKRKLKGCGSTFVGIVFDATAPGAAIALHVGDSRLYRLRGKELRQITKDHSVAEMMGAKDESQLNPMFRGMILRAVGIESSVEVDQTPMSVAEGDVVLVCSDGLSRMVPDKRIGEIIREGGDDVEATARRLVDAANEAGGIDNITVALVKIGPLPQPLPVVSFAQGDDSSAASSTRQTLDREYGSSGRRVPRRVMLVIAIVGAVAAFVWAVAQSVLREKPRVLSAPVVEAMPTGDAAAVAPKAVELPVPAPAEPETVDLSPVAVTDAVAEKAVSPSVTSREDSERDAVADELRAERERRKRADDAVAGLERKRREVALALADTYDRSFGEFAAFVSVVFGKGASDRAQSLCRQLNARKEDANVSMFAADFTGEVAELARKLVVKCSRKAIQQDSAVIALVTRCQPVVDGDPTTPETQQKCLELIEFVAEQRVQVNGRK